MKKYLLFGAFALVFLAMASSVHATDWVDWNFENGSVTGWTNEDAANGKITATNFYVINDSWSGNYTSSGSAKESYLSITGEDDGYVVCEFNLNTTGEIDQLHNIALEATAGDHTHAMQFYLGANDDYFGIYDGAFNDFMEVKEKQVYHIRFVVNTAGADSTIDTHIWNVSDGAYQNFTGYGSRGTVDYPTALSLHYNDADTDSQTIIDDLYCCNDPTGCAPVPVGDNRTIRVNYTNPIYETVITNHKIYFGNYSINTSSSASLFYNGTEYPATLNWTSENVAEFNVSLETPITLINNSGHLFYWNYTLHYVNGSTNSSVSSNYNQNVLWNLTKYPRVNITAHSLLTGSAISNFTINDSSMTLSTTAGYIYFYKTAAGSFNLTIDADDYELVTENVAFTLNNLTSHNFTLWTTNSIWFYFYDEDTGLIMNTSTVELELISGVFANNYTTTNGTMYLDLLTPAEYLLRYDAINYTERFYYMTLSNRSTNNLTLYLSRDYSNITATVLDEVNNELENATIKAMKYDIATNSYIIRSMCRTNFEGECILDLVKFTEFYKFIIEYPAGETKKITNPAYIFEDSITFQIIVGEEVAEDYYNVNGVTYTLDFNNATLLYNFVWSDSENTVTQGCLYVYRVTGTGSSLVNSTCSSGSSGSVFGGSVQDINGSNWRADVYVNLGDGNIFIDSLWYNIPDNDSQVLGNLGLLLLAFLVMLQVFIYRWSPTIPFITIPITIFLADIINVVNLGLYITVPIIAVGLVLAYLVSDKA